MNCPSYDVNGAINITKKYLETLNEQPVVVLGTPKITGLTDVLSSPRILKLPISMESSSHILGLQKGGCYKTEVHVMTLNKNRQGIAVDCDDYFVLT